MKRRTTKGRELAVAGTPRPASPQSVFAEDFSLLIRTPRRLRIKRSHIRILH